MTYFYGCVKNWLLGENKWHLSIKDTWFCPILMVFQKNIKDTFKKRHMIVRWLRHEEEEASPRGGFQIWSHLHWGTFADRAKYTAIPHKITNTKRTGNHGDGFEQSRNIWKNFLYCDYNLQNIAWFLNPNTFLRSWGFGKRIKISLTRAVHKQFCFSLSMWEFFPRKQALLLIPISLSLSHSLSISSSLSL